jgi:hypothetical protein
MVNELRELLRGNAEFEPQDHVDITAVLRGGRRRVRRRRLTAVGGTALASAAVIGLTTLVWPSPPDLDAAGVPRPEGPVLRLTDATDAVEGEDYRVLTSHTNEDLEFDNGQYFDGVTEDGKVLFRDGPRMRQLQARYALMDPDTGDKGWLPVPPVPKQETLFPVALDEERLVMTGFTMPDAEDVDESSGDVFDQMRLYAVIYDRTIGEWARIDWPDLPGVQGPGSAVLGPDGRLYVRVPATRGGPPEGGWPEGPDGEADDSDAPGDTYALWSVSLSDPRDARDEKLRLGDLAFTDNAMVWTDSTNGEAGDVHVRDLDTGEESTFDPRLGEKCNLLSFGATGAHVVMGQYCGTYADGVRDDRVQVVELDGDRVVTIQDSDLDGGLSGTGDVVTVSSYQRGGRGGTFVYDLATDRFLRVSDGVSSYGMGGPAPGRQFMWSTPENGRKGATYTLANCLRAARRHGVKTIVCDRPNPIGGVAVEGPMLEKGFESFVGMYPIPMRHGMTIGELARLFNEHFGIGADLEVVKMEGWHRRMYGDETGLPWVLPSPNIPTVETAVVYPGTVLLEGTNVSEGRGTTRPFELVGAPWMAAERCADALNRLELPGVHFRPAVFEPTFHKHAKTSCGGCQIHVVDRGAFRPVETGVAVIEVLRAAGGGAFAWREPPYEYEYEKQPIDILAGSPELREQIDAAVPAREIARAWEGAVARFDDVRRQFLMY